MSGYGCTVVHRRALPIASILLVAACGGDSSAAPIECGDDLATDEELALTPRDDLNLEQLAIVATGRVLAGQEQYDRVVRDVDAIREARPDLQEIGFLPAFGEEIIVRADETTIAEMEASRYEAWDCLNRRFGVTEMTFGTDGAGTPDRVRLELDGVYYTPLLAERYAELPNVLQASSEGVIGDGSTICVTSGESDWHYVVDEGSGDCPLGCIDHDYSYFVTASDGTVTPSGSWTNRSGDPAPSWVTQYVTDQACHGLSLVTSANQP